MINVKWYDINGFKTAVKVYFKYSDFLYSKMAQAVKFLPLGMPGPIYTIYLMIGSQYRGWWQPVGTIN